MAKKMRGLSYSMYKTYRTCPQWYKWRSVEYRPRLEPDRPLNRFLGCVWADVFDEFYKQDMWKIALETTDKKSGIRKTIKKMTVEYKRLFTKYENDVSDGRAPQPEPILWDNPAHRKEFYDEGLAVLPLMREVIVIDKLTSSHAFSEFAMSTVSHNRVVNGRADLVLEKYPLKDDKPDLEATPKVYILDAKGTTNKEGKWLDDDQLYWYAYLYFVLKKQWPDYLGFVMLRFGATKWIEATNEDIKGFLIRLRDALTSINNEEFDPTPSNDACRFCEYKKGCSAFKEMEAERRRNRKPSKFIGVEDSFGKDIFN